MTSIATTSLRISIGALVLQALIAFNSVRAQTTTFEVIHSFAGSDGSCPMRALVRAPDGNWYGTTSQGGEFGGGTLFRLDTAGAVSVVHSFNPSAESRGPNGLVLGQDGLLYGSTYGDYGGDSGSVYVLDSTGRVQTILRFPNGRGAGPIVQGSDGKIYGTLIDGGAYGKGYLYSLTTRGKLTVLHSFDGNGSATTVLPLGVLTEGPDGALYGTTNGAGALGQGAIYRVTRDGEYTLLHSFGAQTGRVVDGQQPWDGVSLGTDGVLYGTTTYAGSSGRGTLFRLAPTGIGYWILSSFSQSADVGQWPLSAPLTIGPSTIIGTTGTGGSFGNGSIFKVEDRMTTVLHSFSGDGTEGRGFPYARLVREANGDLLGSACQGGAYGAGTLFRLRLSAIARTK